MLVCLLNLPLSSACVCVSSRAPALLAKCVSNGANDLCTVITAPSEFGDVWEVHQPPVVDQLLLPC